MECRARKDGLALAVLIGFSAVVGLRNIVSFPSFNYFLDPWEHWRLALDIVARSHIDLQDYHALFIHQTLTAVLQLITGIPLLQLCRCFPVLTGILSTLGIYLISRNLTGSQTVAIAAAFLLSSVADSHVFSTSTFWPEALAISIAPLVLLLWLGSNESGGKDEPRRLLLASLFFATVAMTHDITAVMLLGTVTLTQVVRRVFVKEARRIAPVAALLFSAVFLLLWTSMGRGMYIANILVELTQDRLPIVVLGLAALLTLALLLKKERTSSSFNLRRPLSAFLLTPLPIGLVMTLVSVTRIPNLTQYVAATSIAYYPIVIAPKAFILILAGRMALATTKRINLKGTLLVGWMSTFALASILIAPQMPQQGYLLRYVERLLDQAYQPMVVAAAVPLAAYLARSKRRTKLSLALLSLSLVALSQTGIASALMPPELGAPTRYWHTTTEIEAASWLGEVASDNSILVSDCRWYLLLQATVARGRHNIRFLYPLEFSVRLIYPSNHQVLIAEVARQGPSSTYLIVYDTMKLYSIATYYFYDRPLTDEEAREYTQASYLNRIYDNGQVQIYRLVQFA